MRIEHWIYEIPLRLRSLFRRTQVERDLDDELQYHVERQTEELMARGFTRSEARRAALRALGGLTQRKEECRETRRVQLIDDLVQDLRYALRILAKSRGFTAVAVLTLALAIGANAVVFGLLDGFLLRPLDVPQAESLYGIEKNREHSMWESYPDYLDLRDRNRSFDGLAGFTIDAVGFDAAGGRPAASWINTVTANYFDVLRLEPYLGRFFHASDDHGPDSAPYVVLSYGFWHTRFHDDPAAIGRVVRLNRHPFTVIGVAPRGFHGAILFATPDFFVPMVNQEQIEGRDTLSVRATETLFMVLGHLKPGVTPAQAAADLDSIGAWMQRTYPRDHAATKFVLARPGLYGNYFGRPMRAFFGGLMALAALVLLAACANLGNLFGARAAERSREVALRLALGARRNRVLRQVLTEAVLISLAGGALGLWASVVLLRGLTAWNPFPQYPTNIPVSPDAKVYAVALLLALASGLLFGLVPVRQVLRADAYQVVKAGPGGRVGRRLGFRDVLLVAQIAVCAVLVTSSLVAARGFVRSTHSNFGFEPRHALLVESDLNDGGYRGEAVSAVERRLVESVESIPGVEAVGSIGEPPLNAGGFDVLIFRDDAADLRPAKAAFDTVRANISPNYFRAAHTALLAGRAFTWHDDKDAPAVAVVNREFARRLFGSVPGALGRRFQFRDGTRAEVVGVVENGKYGSLTEDPQPALFLPFQQAPISEICMVVRSSRDPRELTAAIQNAMNGVDRGLPVMIRTWEEELQLALFPARIATIALGVMGGIGAVLAITGIFGMAAYSLSKRLRELGIRIAVGARPREVLEAALGRAFRLLAVGSAAGLGLGLLASRVLAAVVYQASPRDPLVMTGVVVAMLVLGLVATWIPAQRALSLDPLRLLREE